MTVHRASKAHKYRVTRAFDLHKLTEQDTLGAQVCGNTVWKQTANNNSLTTDLSQFTLWTFVAIHFESKRSQVFSSGK